MSSGPDADTAGQDFCQNDGELKSSNYIPIYSIELFIRDF